MHTLEHKFYEYKFITFLLYKTKEHLREVTFDHFCFLNL